MKLAIHGGVDSDMTTPQNVFSEFGEKKFRVSKKKRSFDARIEFRQSLFNNHMNDHLNKVLQRRQTIQNTPQHVSRMLLTN